MTGKSDYTLELLSRDPGICAHALFPKEFIGFDGHFPGAPLLPGFMHIQLALDVLRKAGEPCELKEVVAARFTLPILPEMRVNITVTRTDDRNRYEVIVACREETCSVFTLAVEQRIAP